MILIEKPVGRRRRPRVGRETRVTRKFVTQQPDFVRADFSKASRSGSRSINNSRRPAGRIVVWITDGRRLLLITVSTRARMVKQNDRGRGGWRSGRGRNVFWKRASFVFVHLKCRKISEENRKKIQKCAYPTREMIEPSLCDSAVK